MRSANLTLRQATSVRTLCRDHYAPEVIEGWLANRSPRAFLAPIGRGDIFVVEHEGQIVGFGEAGRGTIIAVYVDPAAIHRGVGATIMERALAIARTGHKGPIRVESSLNAEAFYERFGFRVVERSTVQRNQIAIPAVVMELDEESTPDQGTLVSPDLP